MSILPQNSFNSGEITPLAYGRVDLAKYRSALQTCRNMVVTPHGGVTRRPGTEYIATTKNESEAVRLIPFTFNTEQAYIIEAGPNYMRFYKDGGQIQTVDTNTKLLLNMGGANNSNVFTDSGNTGHTVTPVGGVVIDTDVKQHGTGSGKFDGTNYLSIADHSDFQLGGGTGNFTVDFPVTPASLLSGGGFFSQYVDDDNFYKFSANSTQINFTMVSSGTQIGSMTATHSLSISALSHMALIRGWGGVANTWAITVNGTAVVTKTITNSVPDFAAAFEIGRHQYVSAEYLTGWIGAGFRISDVARWTSDFSSNLPASLYPNAQTGGGGSAYEIETPYIEADLPDLQFVQSADTMYIVHPNYSPRKLTRTAHTSWTLTTISFTATPSHWGAESKAITGITAANPGVVTSAGHGLADDDVILITNVAGMTEVNGYTYTVDGVEAADITGITKANPGVVTSAGHGLSNGDLVYIRDVAGMTELNGTTQTVANKTDNTFEIENTSAMTAYTSGGEWEVTSFQLSGVDTSGFTAYSSGGVWNEYSTNPATVALHEERVMYSGEPNSPQTIDMSKSGDFEDMTTGVSDDDGIQYTISADRVNAIRWMVTDRQLLLGTSGGEWRVSGSGGTDDPITPTSISVKQMSRIGSQAIRPISIGNEYIYVQNIGKAIRTLSYKYEDDAYGGINLSVLGQHLTKTANIVEIAYQQQPYQIVWAVLDSGALIGLTYMLDHEVIGWHRHDTGASGEFENVATIPGSTDDEIWFVVKRTIDGSTTRYIERLKTFWTNGDAEDAFFVDSGLTYEGASATTISGLDHLEAETAVIWSEGAAENSEVVSSGSVTVDNATTKATFGIQITSDSGTLRLDPGDGSFQGKTKTIYGLDMRVYETIGYTYGKDSSNLDTKTHSSLTSDDDKLAFDGVMDTKGQVFIRKIDGGPLTILSIMPKFNAYNE